MERWSGVGREKRSLTGPSRGSNERSAREGEKGGEKEGGGRAGGDVKGQRAETLTRHGHG